MTHHQSLEKSRSKAGSSIGNSGGGTISLHPRSPFYTSIYYSCSSKMNFWKRRPHTRNETLTMVWEFTVALVSSWFHHAEPGAHQHTQLWRMLQLPVATTAATTEQPEAEQSCPLEDDEFPTQEVNIVRGERAAENREIDV